MTNPMTSDSEELANARSGVRTPPKSKDRAPSLIRFTISASSHGKERKLKVYVYPTLEAMYEATDAWAKKRSEVPVKHNYHAITHSYNKIDIGSNGKEVDYPNVGIIRYTRGYLYSYIIVHEIAHAALNIYQLDCVNSGDLADDHLDPSNETFCHIVSELEHNIVSKLNRLGAYR